MNEKIIQSGKVINQYPIDCFAWNLKNSSLSISETSIKTPIIPRVKYESDAKKYSDSFSNPLFIPKEIKRLLILSPVFINFNPEF